MPPPQTAMTHSVHSATLADVLERILDKGMVIAGDIKIKLVDIELLTIQIRLLIASVDKAKEIGMDWWVKDPAFSSRVRDGKQRKELEALRAKVAALERALPPCASQAQRRRSTGLLPVAPPPRRGRGFGEGQHAGTGPPHAQRQGAR